MSTSAAFDRYERDRWRDRAAAYEGSLGSLCASTAPAVLDAVGVESGCHVLDAGTGPGPLARAAAERGAIVFAVDAELSMLGLARTHAPPVSVCQAALPDLPFPDGRFDAVVANFVINHLGDPTAGVTELARVARHDASVAVTIWPHPAAPSSRLWAEAFEASGAKRPVDLPTVPEDKNFRRTAEGLSDLMRSAGLRHVRCETITWAHRIDPDAWWDGSTNGISTIGALIRDQPSEVKARIRHAYERLSAPYRGTDGMLALPTAALLASGRVV